MITLLKNETNLYMKKCFFQTYKIAIFQYFFYEKTSKYLQKHMYFYVSMMKPEAAIGDVL